MLKLGKCPECGTEEMLGNSFYYDVPICCYCVDTAKEAEENGESLSTQRMVGRRLGKPQSKRESRLVAQGRAN